MDIDKFLQQVQTSPTYRGQIVHVHELPAREARYAPAGAVELSGETRRMLRGMGVEQLYEHQAEAIATVQAGRDVLVTTGTASGKSLCYVAPLIEMLARDDQTRSLLLFPTKALCQDQYKAFGRALAAAGLGGVTAGVYDGDTPSTERRKLRDHGSVIFSNPDMVHASLMCQHTRWAPFLSRLRLVVLDELHVYNGIFGANMANLLRRFDTICTHYGAAPRIVACSATIGNPGELAERLTGRTMAVVDSDGSPRGRRVYVFWNPPVVRGRTWRSRRSANVEAHELMAELISRGAATIAFSKAKMTAEMIHRYVTEKLQQTAPHLVKKVTPYRGGYRPAERRQIESRLFAGELLGVSTTRALELGIDVGGLDACIVVGYPGTLASFFQQTGRAGRRQRDALVVLVGLDTAVNQYVMTHPDYIFERPVEQTVVDADNPFVVTGHLRCAAHELPVPVGQAGRFGPHAELVLKVLAENHKVRLLSDHWYHAATEIPQHEISLRDTVDKNVLIEDVDTGEVLGEVNKLDAPPILHPGAIYIHRGDTYRVLELDLTDKYIASVKRVDVDYYTQPLGGTDIHHIDAQLREKPFGTGRACWGEVTAYFNTNMYEKVRFYELDAISRHGVDLPTFQLETMAVWLIPPEELTERVRQAGLDAHAGLRGIGYATRMLLPLFITCDTLSFSHTIGAVNAPWQTIFIYERHPLGLGFTRKAYDLLDRIIPAVMDAIRNCPCDDGCPCCTGKPLRQYATWNVERGEASIPSKAAARMILEGMLGDGKNLSARDMQSLSDDEQAKALRLEQTLRRRLERMREPEVFHPIRPDVTTATPAPEKRETLDTPDVARRSQRRRDFHKDLRKRLAKRMGLNGLNPHADGKAPPKPMPPGGNLRPQAFGDAKTVAPEDVIASPPTTTETPTATHETPPPAKPNDTIQLGDSLATRARRRMTRKRTDGE